jgi:hypothetical protein
MAICCVSEKIQTAHQPNTLRALDFFASLFSPFLNDANFEFFNSQVKAPSLTCAGAPSVHGTKGTDGTDGFDPCGCVQQGQAGIHLSFHVERCGFPSTHAGRKCAGMTPGRHFFHDEGP